MALGGWLCPGFDHYFDESVSRRRPDPTGPLCSLITSPALPRRLAAIETLTSAVFSLDDNLFVRICDVELVGTAPVRQSPPALPICQRLDAKRVELSPV